MATVTVTFTITELCLRTGVSEEELTEIVGLGMIEPHQPQAETWLFDDSAVTIVHRAVRLRNELELDWPGIAVALTLLDENARLTRENRLLQQRLAQSACLQRGGLAVVARELLQLSIAIAVDAAVADPQDAGAQARRIERRDRGADGRAFVPGTVKDLTIGGGDGAVDLGDVVFGAHRDIEVDTAVLC